jgi:hypothetical protein
MGLTAVTSAASGQQPTFSQSTDNKSSAPSQQSADLQDTKGADNTSGQPKGLQPSAGFATIHIYREGGMVGAAAFESIFINDVFVVSLKGGRFASTEVQPGTAVFSILPGFTKMMIGYAAVASLQKKPTEILRLNVEAGKTYYVKRKITGLSSKYVQMEEASGAKEMRKLKPAKEEDTGKPPKFR